MTAIEAPHAGAHGALRHRLSQWARPIDIASLAVFRVLFGLVMAAGMLRFLHAGWVRELYITPKYFFPYDGFEWVRPWPDPWMHLHVIALAVLALGIAAGAWYRACSCLFFLGFTWLELLDKTNYLNHYYLVSLVSGLLVFLPAQRALSVDAWLHPRIRTAVVPAWTIDVLRFQAAVVYVYAGIAKLNHDWLLAAQPLRIWLAARSDLPVVGPLLDETWVAFLASWAGAAYDLAIVPLLCWRRSRPWAYAAVVAFHLATLGLFRIGMFPWIMMTLTLVFLPPDWPRRWLRRFLPQPDTRVAHARPAPWRSALLFAYAAVQVLVPLRAYAQSDSCAWTWRGFNFSWHVMIAEKAGHVELRAFDPATGCEWEVPLQEYVTARQRAMMAQDPWMIRALACHVAGELRRQGHAGVQVRARAHATLNGRPSQLLVDPLVDLAGPLPENWILPLSDG